MPKFPAHETETVEFKKSLAELKQGLVSLRCNPLIEVLFRRIHLVEAWGRGVPLILENAPDVEFQEVAGLFVASFKRPTATQETTAKTTRETTRETTAKTGQEKPEKHQSTLLQHLLQEPAATIPQLAQLNGLSVDGVRYHLNHLKRAGKLRRHAPTKGGYWEVLD